MDPSFNPYHRWLGIRDTVLPPHHYRLLGLEPFEENPNVIQAAAERQMGHVRTFANGPQAVQANQLLSELSAARVCLLNPHRKQEYDQQLRARLAQQPAQQAAPPTQRPMPAAPTAPVPPMPQPVAEPEPETNWNELEQRLAREENPHDLFEGDQEARRRAVFSPFVKAAAIGWCITLVVLIAGWAYLSSQPKPERTGPKIIRRIVVIKPDKPKPKPPPPRTGPRELAVEDVFRGHTAGVWSLAWLGNNELVTGSIDHTVRIWSRKTDEQVESTQSPESVSMLAVHAPSRQIAFCGPDGSVRLWKPAGNPIPESPETKPAKPATPEPATPGSEVPETETSEPQLLVMHPADALCVAFSKDGKLLASGDEDGGVLVYGTNRIVKYQLGDDSGPVDAVAFTPDGKRLLAGAADGNIRTWTLADGKPGDLLRGHEFSVLALAVTTDNRRLFSGGQDHSVRSWLLPEGKPQREYLRHEAPVRTVAVSPDGKRLASADLNGAIYLWDVQTGEVVAQASGHQAAVFSLAFSPNGRRLASASSDTTVRIWSLEPK